MRFPPFIVITLSLLPLGAYADTTLYACINHGQTTLEDTPSEHCDILKTYHYASQKSPENSEQPSGLRQGEIQQLQGYGYGPTPEQREKRYEHVDDRVGWSLAQSYHDEHAGNCNYYYALLNSALAYINVKNSQFIEIGPTDSAQLQVQIDYAQSQINDYCQ